MAQWIFLNELEQARSLYLDAYRQSNGSESLMIQPSNWDELSWLELETEKLILSSIKIKEGASE